MKLDDPRAVLLKQAGASEVLTQGTVAVLCQEATRSQGFWFSLMNLIRAYPPSLMEVRAYQGSDTTALRNRAVEEFVGDWIWFIDDDHAFNPDTFERLYKRNVDIVQALCLRRVSPFYPVATSLDGNFLRLNDHGENDLVEVMYAGASGMLIRRNVLDKIGEPWFDIKTGQSEDVGFCDKARDAGFKIHVDMGVRLGHASAAMIWPVWDEEKEDDQWVTGIGVAGANLKILQVEPPPLEENE